jgi:hypothetical protein
MSIVKDMAVTASLALNAMVGYTACDVSKIDQERREYELWILQSERKENSKTTEITKYYLLHPPIVEEFGKNEASFLGFVQKFADDQVSLDDDFLAALARMEARTRNPTPKRARF